MENLKRLITIRVSEEFFNSIDDIARALGVTRSRLIKTGLGEYLNYLQKHKLPQLEGLNREAGDEAL